MHIQRRKMGLAALLSNNNVLLMMKRSLLTIFLIISWDVMHHEASGFWATGFQMSGHGRFNSVRVMDASFPHADLLFAAII